MSDIGDKVRATRRSIEDIGQFVGFLQQPEQETGAAVLGEVSAVMSRLAIPPARPADGEDLKERDRQWAQLVAFERHGDGLHRYDASMPCARGDLLIGSARTMWLVQAVDEAGLPTWLIGGEPEDSEELVLRWRPVATARVWLSEGDAAAPGYADVAAALSEVVGLWGAGGPVARALDSPGALLRQLAQAEGVQMRLDGLDVDDKAAVREWLAARGARAAAGGPPALPGDVIWSSEREAAGIVLRVDEARLDILLPGGNEEGSLGEPKRAARIVRAEAPSDGDMVWRPD